MRRSRLLWGREIAGNKPEYQVQDSPCLINSCKQLQTRRRANYMEFRIHVSILQYEYNY